MKNIIFTDDINIDDVVDDFEYMSDEARDDALYNMVVQNFMDTQEMLNQEVRVLAIADLGLWNGRVKGTRLFKNLKDILSVNGGIGEWYIEGRNVKSINSHHDGTNYVTYRLVKDDISDESIENLINKINGGKNVKNTIYQYTRSLVPIVKECIGM